MDGGGGMGAMQMMMPMMMMMYMQNNNGTFPGMNMTKVDRNGTDPFGMLHHYFFPVPEEVELSYFQKFLYYCPWIELLICFGIMGLIFGAVIYFFPKDEEEVQEEEEEETPIATESVRSILDGDADDATKLAKIRELVPEKRIVAADSKASAEEKTSAAEEKASADEAKTSADKKDD